MTPIWSSWIFDSELLGLCHGLKNRLPHNLSCCTVLNTLNNVILLKAWWLQIFYSSTCSLVNFCSSYCAAGLPEAQPYLLHTILWLHCSALGSWFLQIVKVFVNLWDHNLALLCNLQNNNVPRVPLLIRPWKFCWKTLVKQFSGHCRAIKS